MIDGTPAAVCPMRASVQTMHQAVKIMMTTFTRSCHGSHHQNNHPDLHGRRGNPACHRPWLSLALAAALVLAAGRVSVVGHCSVALAIGRGGDSGHDHPRRRAEPPVSRGALPERCAGRDGGRPRLGRALLYQSRDLVQPAWLDECASRSTGPPVVIVYWTGTGLATMDCRSWSGVSACASK